MEQKKEVVMLITKNSFKKNMAIIVCVVFISVISQGAVNAATRTSSTVSSFSENSFSFFSPVYSFTGLNLLLLVSDNAAVNKLSTDFGILSKKNKKDEEGKTDQTEQTKKGEKGIGSYDDNGNSTSRKPANGRDNK